AVLGQCELHVRGHSVPILKHSACSQDIFTGRAAEGSDQKVGNFTILIFSLSESETTMVERD
ncbi:MAG: hypothetical protein VX955_06025, partial [Pseudomonadota bacterium]|nr:hypothetical protein [Pseudomonadota bacterium]